MNLEEFNYCKDVYNDCCINGTLEPQRIKNAYWIITNRKEEEPLVSVRKAKQTIFNFFQHLAKDVLKDLKELMDYDETDSNLPKTSDTISVDNDNQSHTEQVLYQGISHTGATTHIAEMRDADNQQSRDSDIGDTQVVDNDHSGNHHNGDNQHVSNDEIAKLKAEYKDAETNVKRSITMRIKAIEKRLKDNA